MAKSNQKCVRMTDEIMTFVEKQKGEGFNQKFENTIYRFIKEEKEKEKKLVSLDIQIKAREETIQKLDNQIKDRHSVLNALDSIKNLTDNLINRLKNEEKGLVK